MSALPNIPQRKHPLAICEKCPLVHKPIAMTTGPANAEVAIVSRSPGAHEASSGKSFSGPSGKVLDHLLKLHGSDRSHVLATNVVLCQSDGAEVGFPLAVSACEPRLAAELAECQTVIAAGREAAWSVLGVTSIATNRGYVHKKENNISSKIQRIIVTNNPAVVLRDDGNFPELVRDFRLALDPLPTPELPKVRWIDDLEEATAAVSEMHQVFKQLPAGSLVACDIETRGVDGRSGLEHTAQVVCIGFSIRAERAVVFGEKVCLGGKLGNESFFLKEFIGGLLEFPHLSYLWHNGKYDTKILRNHGIKARVDEDSLLLSWALDERPGDPESGAGGHSLEWLLKDELGWPKYESTSVRTFKKTGVLENPAELYQYNGFDTAGTMTLFEILKHRAINDNVWDKPYKSLLIRLSETLTRMEMQGNLFDADRACDILETEVWPLLRTQRGQMRSLSAVPALNPNSPKQLEQLLYESWKITHKLSRPGIEKMGKRSTDKFVREELMLDTYSLGIAEEARPVINQFVQTLDDFKSLDKQRSTYFEGLVLRQFPDGRIYTEFKEHGTESGRLSSANPNMQNVTRTKDGMPSIRSCFLPDPGCVFVSADLSQAELRTIAYLSNDKALQSIYLESGRSLHKEVAMEFYGPGYSKEQYVVAKNINFGVAYWQSAYTFSQRYHMPYQEAQKFIDFWWNRFPQVWEWTKKMEAQVLTVGEIQSPFGHKRRFYIIPADKGGQLHVVKEGINFLPQNIAGNITLWAMCDFAERVDWRIAQPRINVHDNIVANCKEEHVDEVAHLLVDCMQRAPKEAINWEFPFTADVSVGHNWGALKDYEL